MKKGIMGEYTYLIIGSAAAGLGAMNKLGQLDPDSSILCISDEIENPYNKCFLADYLSGEKNEAQLFTRITHKNISFALGKRVVSIDREKKLITMSDNARVGYGKLLLATGSSPVIPPISGIESEGVFTFHTLADANRILAYVKRNDFAHVTIIGAGLSGLEAADALRSQNLEVLVVDRASHVLASQVDLEAADYIQKQMKEKGIAFLPHTSAQEIMSANGKVQGISLSNGEQISTHAIICATGLKPNSTLAQQCGLRLMDDSVWVDQNMRTSDEHIYAAGDLVVVKDQLTGKLIRSCTWQDAMHQGLIAAHSMAQNPKPYPGIMIVTTSAFFGVKFAACGYDPHFLKGEGITTVSCKGSPEEYCKMFVKNGVPSGFIMIGTSLPQLGALRRSVILRQPFTPKPYKPLG